MSSSRHIICKLSVEVQLPGKYAATHQEQALTVVKTWLNKHLLPALEAALDKMEARQGSRQVLCFDRLDIDLGQLAPDELSVRSALAIANSVQAAANHTTAAPATIKSPTQRATEAFAFFLERGYLPWWYGPGKPDAGVWEEQLEQALSKQGLSAGTIAEVLKTKTSRQRLANLFETRFLLNVMVKQCFPAEAQQVSALWNELSVSIDKLPRSASKSLALKSQLWEWIFEWLSLGSLHKSSLREFVVRQLWTFLSSQESDRPAGMKSSNLPKLLATALIKPLAAAPISLMETKSPHPEAKPDTAFASEDETAIYVANAGIILLHPFLQMFFEALGLSENGILMRPDKAVHLLQCLSTGSSKAEEHELVLNKILCGLKPETYIKPPARPTRKEQQECKQILEAVIRNWPALKNTSPKGLQHNYLCREGALSLRPEGGWFLKISTNTIDILLNQLPWGISWVKLPWMPHVLQVEWN